LKRVSSWIQRGSFLVGRTTPTANSVVGASVAAGASVASGTAVGVAPQADRTIAATNNMDSKTYSELFWDIIFSFVEFTCALNGHSLSQ
jgi:hypothetical protein